MTNMEMVKHYEQLKAMQKRETDDGIIRFPGKIKVTYAIRKNMNLFEQELSTYEEERARLIEECREGDADAEGNVSIAKEKQETWLSGMKELQSIEVDLKIHTIAFEEVNNCHLSLADMEAIEFMLLAPQA